MRRITLWHWKPRTATCLLGLAVLISPARASEAVDFEEVFSVLKANLAGATEPDLKRAAAMGLIEHLSPRVLLLDDAAKAPVDSGVTVVATGVFDRSYGYVRLGAIGADAGRQFGAALDGLSTTNTLKGLVLDLRFSTGSDFGAAMTVADRFFASPRPLADWGEGARKSTAKSNAVAVPVTVLVNRKTAGAAEVIAGILRHGEVGLIVGSNTAGQANVAKDFTLKTGQRLRVAVAPVKVAEGTELPFTGLKPDIEVKVSSEDELAYLENAYRTSGKLTASTGSSETIGSSTNRIPRRRLNEAELVRLAREGQDVRDLPGGTLETVRASDSTAPVVTDPVLARALDILKGLAVVQRFRAL